MGEPARIKSRTAYGFKALHSVRNIGVTTPTSVLDYAAFTDDLIFKPHRVQESVGPAFAKAQLTWDLWQYSAFAGTSNQVHAWNWRTYFNLEDRVLIVERKESSPKILFVGFASDIDLSFGPNDDSVRITAVSQAIRLVKDSRYQVYGRYMVSKGAALRHYSGLPCAFNAGGYANRSKTKVAVTGGPVGGVYVFVADDRPESADFWTIADIVQYLQWMYNADEAWVGNISPSAALLADTRVIQYIAEGRNLYAAICEVAGIAGYDIAEYLVTDDDDAWPVMKAVRQHNGTARTVKHAAPTPVLTSGVHPRMDLATTNLFSAAIAENSSGSTSEPIVLGGRKLYMITVTLGQCWDADLAVLGGGFVIGSWAGTDGKGNNYFKRFTPGGEDFATYVDVGRLWVADTDGRYGDDPWNLSLVDMATVAGETANTWPPMLHPPLPSLRAIDGTTISISGETWLDYSLDAGTNWYSMRDGFSVLPDRLGVRLTRDNLADIGHNITGHYTGGLFKQLIADATQVQMRLTCTIAGPVRNVAAPARRVSAGTIFKTGAVIDRSALGQTRVNVSTATADYDVAGATELARLTAAAAEAQITGEARSIEASLPIEWPDEDLQLTDCITTIDGIAYSLQTNVGATALYPRIVGRTLHLTPDNWQMTLVLDTHRRSGVISPEHMVMIAEARAGR
jgi:hypothetical protein